MNIVDYNDAKLRQRNLKAVYPEGVGYDWQWDGETSRKRYEGMRVKSDQMFRNSLFVVGGIVVNHLVSGIDAVRVARKKSATDGIKVGFAGLPGGGGMVWIVKRF
jgi:hypothetical protein